MIELSVVVPVHNEQDNVTPLLEEIHAALEGHHEFEVIYVNDGSSDRTGGALAAAMRQFPRLRVLTHARQCGQSAALHSAVSAARGEWIVTLDGDGQNDPADIARLLAVRDDPAQPANLQLIAGSRRKRQDSWLRRFSSRVANGVRSRLLRDGTRDTGCGLKLFRRATFLQLPFFDHMHRFLPALVQRNGGVSVSVEVRHRPRLRGQSKYGVQNRLWVGIVDLLGVMWLQRRMCRPTLSEETR